MVKGTELSRNWASFPDFPSLLFTKRKKTYKYRWNYLKKGKIWEIYCNLPSANCINWALLPQRAECVHGRHLVSPMIYDEFCTNAYYRSVFVGLNSHKTMECVISIYFLYHTARYYTLTIAFIRLWLFMPSPETMWPCHELLEDYILHSSKKSSDSQSQTVKGC